MAHFVQPPHARKYYLNYNERLYWLHRSLLNNLEIEFKERYEALDRMYRLLRNCGTNDLSTVKKSGVTYRDAWLYSEVHNGIARCTIELKVALNKCANLDTFLDSCSQNKAELDLAILSEDITNLIEDVTKCLNTVENSHIRLKKLQMKFKEDKDIVVSEERDEVGTHDDKDSTEHSNAIREAKFDVKDEVFYLIKTDDDISEVEPVDDVTIGPGKKERETNQVVLKELKRKLIKVEDVMRERERQALVNTMPEFKGNVPEFPRQIEVNENTQKVGYIRKLLKVKCKKELKQHKIRHYIKNALKRKVWRLQQRKCTNLDSEKVLYASNSPFSFIQPVPIKVAVSSDKIFTVIKMLKISDILKDDQKNSNFLNDSNVVDKKSINKYDDAEKNDETINSLDSDLSFPSDEDDIDIEKLSVARNKKYHAKRDNVNGNIDHEDEGMKPIQYSLGTGLAMASMLHVNSKHMFPSMIQEDVFIADGEISSDSGNDDV